MKRAIEVAALMTGVALLLLLPHDAEKWIWVRALIATVVLIGVLHRRGVWFDALLGGFLIVIITAVGQVAVRDPGAPKATVEPRALFVLQDSVVKPVRKFAEKEDVVLLVVEAKRGPYGRVNDYETHRFDARLRTELGPTTTPVEVEVSIERGAKDENLIDFTQALAGASTIYVKEAPKKK